MTIWQLIWQLIGLGFIAASIIWLYAELIRPGASRRRAFVGAGMGAAGGILFAAHAYLTETQWMVAAVIAFAFMVAAAQIIGRPH